MKITKKKEIIRKLSSCIKEKFNGFTFAQINLAKNKKHDLIPVNIVYKPVKKQDEVINCFFTADVKNAFRAVYNNSQGIHTANQLYECYYCSDFFLIKSKFEKHIRVCGKKPGFFTISTYKMS